MAPRLNVETNLDDCKVKLRWSFIESDRDVHIKRNEARLNWTTWGARLVRCVNSFGFLMDMVTTEIEDTLTTPNDYLEVLHGMLCECPDGALEIFHWTETSMWQPRKTSGGGYTWPATFYGGAFHEFCLNIRRCLKRDQIPSRKELAEASSTTTSSSSTLSSSATRKGSESTKAYTFYHPYIEPCTPTRSADKGKTAVFISDSVYCYGSADDDSGTLSYFEAAEAKANADMRIIL